MAKDSYDASSIQLLEGLKAVRKRPGMYIGSTGSAGLHHLLWEIIDNSVDEFLANYCKEIRVTINKDDSCTVEDDGRGIPTGMHSSGIPAAELIFTKLHAGGKFGGGDSGYKKSGGLHGVGSSVVNALSTSLEVEIFKDKKKYTLKFNNGGEISQSLQEEGNTKKSGTKVHFKPDHSIFSHTVYDAKVVVNRIRETAFLNKGLKIYFLDKRTKEQEEIIFEYENGLVDFIKYLNKDQEVLHEPVLFEEANKELEAIVAFQYSDQETERILSFANNIRTIDGGQHESGFKAALTKSINEYCNENNIFKKSDKNFDGSEVRYGLTAIISIYISEELLQFEGQTKTKLGTIEAKTFIDKMIYKNLKFWLIENKTTTHKIIDLAFAVRRAKEEARKSKLSNTTFSKKKNIQILSGKLVHAHSKDPIKKEIFLVEGDSAGGSAKLGRDNRYQAILPLKGKVINVEKSIISHILKNEEIITMISAIGTGIGKEFDYSNLNYHKIIIMTDADTDGAHIQALILTFFHKYMKRLIEKGHIYIALPPLYKVSKKGKDGFSKYLWTDAHLEATKKEHGKVEIQRYKGLGEMNYDQLWETTMDPETRTLIQVEIDDALKSRDMFDKLMGANPAERRKWIEENIDFSREDDFVSEWKNEDIQQEGDDD